MAGHKGSTITVAILMAVLIDIYNCYPTGAPPIRCESMTPGHGNESTDATPYTLSTNTNTYTAGGTINGKTCLLSE